MGPVSPRFGKSVLILSANFDRVIPLNHRKVLLPIIRSVGAGDYGISLDAADKGVCGVSEGIVVQRRHFKVLLVLRTSTQRSGVQTQCIGIDIVINPDTL